MKINKTTYMSKSKYGNYVFDYHKLAKSKFPFIILISERGAKGKTFMSKQYLKEVYDKYGWKGIWVLNTTKQFEKEVQKFLKNNKKEFPDLWENSAAFKKGVSYTGKPGDYQIEFQSLYDAEVSKGSRDYTVKTIIYDEFNVKLERVGNKQLSLLETLINTYTDHQQEKNDLKVFIHGNFKTLNTPLLVDLKITKIEEELTYIYDDNNNPLIMIYAPFIDKEDVEKQFSNNWAFNLGKYTGSVDHNFYNENLLDNINGIRDYDVENSNTWYKLITYIIDGRFYDLYRYGNEEKLHLKLNRNNPITDIVAIKKKDMEPSYTFGGSQISISLLNYVAEDKITFDSMNSKTAILDIIK